MLDLWLNAAAVLALAGAAIYVTILPYTTWFDE